MMMSPYVDLRETGILAAELLEILPPSDCVWTSVHVSAESEPREFHRLALASNRSAARSTDLRGEAERRRHQVRQQQSQPRPDALFVLRGIGAAFGFGNHFGIRRQDRPGAGARGKNTKRNATHLFLFLSRPAH